MFDLLCALLVFAPQHYLARFGLDTISLKYRGLFTLGILAFSFLLLTHIFEPSWERHKERKRIKAGLNSLGMDELLILQKYVDSGRNSMQLSPMNGSVQRLANCKILYRSTELGTPYGFGYSVAPLALPYLTRKKFQKLLFDKQYSSTVL